MLKKVLRATRGLEFFFMLFCKAFLAVVLGLASKLVLKAVFWGVELLEDFITSWV